MTHRVIQHRKEFLVELGRYRLNRIARQVFEFIPEVFFLLVNSEGMIISCNNFFHERMGYDLQEIVGEPFIQFVAPDDRKRSMQRFREVEKATGAYDFVNRFVTSTEQLLEIQWKAKLVEDGMVIGFGRELPEICQRCPKF